MNSAGVLVGDVGSLMVMKSTRSAVRRPERGHQSEEIRIGFEVRTPESGRDSPDAHVTSRWAENAETVQRRRQHSGSVEGDRPAGELLLVRSAIGVLEQLVVCDQGLLDPGIHQRACRAPDASRASD